MKEKNTSYTPIFFLSALWPGGMSVAFFMYLMFLIPRNSEKFPIPNFDIILSVWNSGNIYYQITIVLAYLWIITFSLLHLKHLFWNLKKFFEFKKTKEYLALKKSNAEISLMAIPLTLAMTINVLFIIWAVFVPWLWNYVEYLFPFALLSFILVWFLGLSIFMDYFVRLILKHTDADFTNNNSLGQMLSVFAFVMIGVWFAASVAMSTVKLTIFIWLIGSVFFLTIAIFLLLLKLTLGFKAIFEHWIDKVQSPSLWIIIPILTLIWITFIRQTHWLHEFGLQVSQSTYILLTLFIFSLQVFFWYIGYKVMSFNWYFDEYLNWKEKAPWSYALACPWVAIVVFWFFFIHLWLVKSWIVTKFSIPYFIILLPVLYFQIKTILVIFKLNKKFF